MKHFAGTILKFIIFLDDQFSFLFLYKFSTIQMDFDVIVIIFHMVIEYPSYHLFYLHHYYMDVM